MCFTAAAAICCFADILLRYLENCDLTSAALLAELEDDNEENEEDDELEELMVSIVAIYMLLLIAFFLIGKTPEKPLSLSPILRSSATSTNSTC